MSLEVVLIVGAVVVSIIALAVYEIEKVGDP